MSMLSSQINELRQMADGGVTYRDAREVMLRAADTIWELRDDLQRANAENAKLRELVRFIMHQCNDGNPRCDECIDWNDGECVALLRMRELGVEVGLEVEG